MDIRTRLSELAMQEFNCDADKIKWDTPIKELGIDSIGMLEFIFRVEDVFDIHIENEQAEKVQSLAHMADLIQFHTERTAE